MLKAFAMLFYQSWTELRQMLTKLWDQFPSDEVFDGLFATRFGVDVYFKLSLIVSDAH